MLQVSGSLSAIESFVQNAKAAGALPCWPVFCVDMCQLDAAVGELEKPPVILPYFRVGIGVNVLMGKFHEIPSDPKLWHSQGLRRLEASWRLPHQ